MPLNEALGKKEIRRLARLQRKAQENERQLRARRRRVGVVVASAGVVILGLVAWTVWNTVRPDSGAATAGLGGQPRPAIIDYPDQGREHILPGAFHPPYNSNPPTSGWHFPQPASWGYYDDTLPDELLVHNLEHGGIWISYQRADDTEVIKQLVALTQRYRSKVIVTLRPKNESRLSVTAWTHVMQLDHYDQAAIVSFIRRFKDQGPELVPD